MDEVVNTLYLSSYVGPELVISCGGGFLGGGRAVGGVIT
jgi:hypothetical protein